jgi:hypothetical protein
MSTNTEIVNMLLACEDLRNDYEDYKHHWSLFPKLLFSHARFPTEHSPNIIKLWQEDSNQTLTRLQAKAHVLQGMGLKSELIEDIIKEEHHSYVIKEK